MDRFERRLQAQKTVAVCLHEEDNECAARKVGENYDEGDYGQLAGIYVGAEIPRLP